jgi:superfamily II DNA or RNA helicase
MAQLSLPGVQPVARPEQAGASRLKASGRIEDVNLGSQSSGSGRPQRKELRPHQHRALDLLRRSAGAGNSRIVIQGPTGFGKTLVAARIIEMARAKGNRVIFTAPAISLIDQTVRAFEAEGLTGIGVMQASHPRTDPSAPIQVASVQTLSRRDIPAASLVIVDECHIRSRVVDRLMDERPDIFFVGLSATPWRKGMGRRWQDLVIPVTIGDLIEHGYLSQFRVLAPDVPDLSGVKTRQGEYVEADLEAVMGEAKLMGHVVETWLEHGAGRPTLLFGVNRAHAAALRASFERAGVAAGYVDAFTDGPERALLERQFRAGEVQVACSVRTLTTGVDWPVSCIIDGAPTKSEMLHVQKSGRGLRVNAGTEDLLVLDHAGNALRLGLVTDIQHTALSSGAEDAPAERAKAERLPKPCAECGTLKAERVCPHCGHESKAGHGVEVAEGQLVEITGKAGKKKPAPTHDEKQIFYSMALWMADERGYSEGWAAHKYRERFGVWPRNLTRDRVPADAAFLGWEKSRRIAWAKGRAKQEARA